MPLQQTNLSQNYAAKDFGWLVRILFGLLVLGSALFFGLAAGVLPWFYIVAFLVLVAMPILAWFLPEYALLVVYTVHLGLLPTQLLGHIVTFIAISGILVFALIRNLNQIREWWPSIRPYAWPFGVLMSLVAMGVVRGLFFQHTQHPLLFEEAQPFMLWLGFPIVYLSLGTEQRLKCFLIAVSILGAYVAIGQALQTIFHQRVFFLGGFNQAEALGQTFGNVIRSVTPAIFVLLLALFLNTTRYLVRPRLWLTLLIALYLLGLFFTFGRAIIVMSLFALALTTLQIGRGKTIRAAVSGLVLIVSASLILAFFKPETFYALFERLLSINAEVHGGRSLSYRLLENSMAIPKIETHPLFGIGLGQFYRQPVVAYISQGTDPILQSRFIHNGYLYVLLKLGFTAFLAYAALIFTFFVHARRLLKRLANPQDRAVVAACIGIMVIPLFTSMVRPEWMSSASTSIFALCFAIVAAVERFRSPPPSVNQSNSKTLRSQPILRAVPQKG